MFISDFNSSKKPINEQNEVQSPIKKIGSKISKGVGRAVNPAMTGLSIADIVQSVRDEDYTGAALSTGSALAYGAGTKFPAIAGPAFAVGAGLDVANVLRDPETRAQIAQAVKKPFTSNTNNQQRGRGRNVLPPGKTASELQSTADSDDVDLEIDKLREGKLQTAIDAAKQAITKIANPVSKNKKSLPKGGARIRTGDRGSDLPVPTYQYYVVRTGGTIQDSAAFPDREQAEKFLKALPDVKNYSVQQQLSFAENKENFTASSGLIQSIKDVESGNNPAAVSPKGALGTMQVMPATARDPGFGVKPAQDFSAQELERVGQDYFNAMLNKYGGDKRLALIAYNMGPAAADKWLTKGADTRALPRETQAYVPKVLGKYQQTETPPTNVVVPPKRQTRLLATPTTTTTTTPTTTARRSSVVSPKYTPTPGSKFLSPPEPELLDPIIKQKNRPDSIEQIIKNKNLKRADLNKLIQLFRNNPEIFASMDTESLNLIQSISDLYNNSNNVTEALNENINSLADLIYMDLESTHGDLVSLYGHEVVGDAIHDVVVKHEQDADVNVPKLSFEVLKLLASRLERQLEENNEDSANNNEKSSNDKQSQNAMIQIQADLDKIKNTLDVKESKIYFNVLATSPWECKQKFGLRKDNIGWFLRESADAKTKLDALRAFELL